MGIAVRDLSKAVSSNINVTPMVDVMLVLLIIFMVITPMLQNKVAIDMAKVDIWNIFQVKRATHREIHGFVDKLTHAAHNHVYIHAQHFG